ncbi:hypothetical protein [Paenibacillus ginsengihumi]|uniref:hypothetical protein n=1 Tax=Paenibacillus ginsengihumi TaxID=431596 RepID=UPI000363E242|nr:hypothetical protein [Paenibacillus ginsengihumi]
MKQWVTVFKHNGYDVQILNGAGVSDPKGYRTTPALPGQIDLFSTVADAVEAIDKYGE